VNGQMVSRNSHKFLTNKMGYLEANQTSWSRRIKIIWLAGMLILLPFDIIDLPLNMTLMDCWILMGLPIFWLAFFRKKQIVNLTYMIPMWFILVGSLISILFSSVPINSVVVILKEVYLFIWFITLTAVLSNIHARDFRHILVIWSGIVLLHGLLIIVQFFSQDFYRFSVSLIGKATDYELYRASGLLINANWAAFFQLLGFVPVMLVSPSKKVAMILGLLLLLTIMATGSMGVTVAFIAGLVITGAVVSLYGHFDTILKFFIQLVIILSIIGGLLLFFVNKNSHQQKHFEHIAFGRAERSSEGRFNLWQRGMNVFSDNNVFLWGIGPDNFREIDGRDKQLHNDVFAFAVERGLIGTLGLLLLALVATGRAVYIVLIYNRHQKPRRLIVVVFLAAITAGLVVSVTHQIFHFRELWVVLACQEAMLFQIKASESDTRSLTIVLNNMSRHHRAFAEQLDISSG
jgi:O-antigen ligase